ncbi:MAG: GntR family transcriptional regulator [Eubacterium sp.]|nr:GntR family transcriptional regulator [Eubacterium sp.]
MVVDFNDLIPLYTQIADAIEDDILSGKLPEGEKCYSQVVIARELNINPATAAKGIRLLVDRGVLDKVRGQAMTVHKGAIEMIKKRKIEQTLSGEIEALVAEAQKLGVPEDSLVDKIRECYKGGGKDE